MKDLVIIGAGGFGRELLAWATGAGRGKNNWRIKGFLDDDPTALKNLDVPLPIIASVDEYEPRKQDVFICAIGQPRIRSKICAIISQRGGIFVTIVHPTAIVAERATLGAGVIVCPYAIVSVDAVVEDGVAIYYHSSVDHDALVGAHSQISAHCDITGEAQLGREVFLGSHATILPGVKIGDRAVVGAGAVVTTDMPAGITAVGVPARILRRDTGSQRT